MPSDTDWLRRCYGIVSSCNEPSWGEPYKCDTFHTFWSYLIRAGGSRAASWSVHVCFIDFLMSNEVSLHSLSVASIKRNSVPYALDQGSGHYWYFGVERNEKKQANNLLMKRLNLGRHVYNWLDDLHGTLCRTMHGKFQMLFDDVFFLFNNQSFVFT